MFKNIKVKVVVGHITYTGSTQLHNKKYAFYLCNLLYIRDLAKSLIYVQKNCIGNHVSIEFLPNSFL